MVIFKFSSVKKGMFLPVILNDLFFETLQYVISSTFKLIS